MLLKARRAAWGTALICLVLIALPFSSLFLYPVSAGQAKKDDDGRKRVAVIPQDDSRTWTKDITVASLEDALKKTGRFTILTRSELDAVMSELKIANSDVVNPKDAVRIGKALSAQYVILARCLGVENKSKSGGFGGIKIGSSEMTCALQMQMINTETTEILASESYNKKKKTGSTFSGVYGASKDADADILKAFTEAVTESANDFAEKLALATPLEGLVVLVKADRVAINAGADKGVAEGQEFEVMIEGDPITDENGNTIGYDRTKVGVIRVVQVEPKLAWCTLVQTFDAKGTPDATPSTSRIEKFHKVRQIGKGRH
ncbi:MAG TPA: CsgG/HfaB family protein [Acidobacteriota bacterium]|nr:CsgG/HfaB family protein [Acidobacteriota bacterium]